MNKIAFVGCCYIYSNGLVSSYIYVLYRSIQNNRLATARVLHIFGFRRRNTQVVLETAITRKTHTHTHNTAISDISV